MKNKKILIHFIRISIIILLISLWELLSNKGIINSFIFSSPSKIIKCIYNLWNKGNLINHIVVTLKEIVISFSISIIASFLISIFLYEFNSIYLVVDPLLTILNSTPKVALGPLIIILFGAGTNSIIIMALSITLIVNILTIYNGFTSTNKYLNLYLDINKATKIDKLKYLVIPSGITTIINSLKINISLTLIGVIMGEFLVSKAGLGYLIVYGTQIFNLTLVLSCVIIVMFISYILYLFINIIEIKSKNKRVM